MQNIGDRIEVKNGKEKIEISIYPKISAKDQLILNVWLIAWSICGVAVISQLFIDSYTSQEKLFMSIYLVFWAYLEFKVLHAFRWNRWGKELIVLNQGRLNYTKAIGKRGLPIDFELSQIAGFQYVSEVEKGIWNDINRSVWMVGGEVIQFVVDGKVRRIGMKLSAKEGERLARLLNKYVKQ